MIPEINSCGFGFPNAGLIDTGQIDQGAVFRTKCHILIGFCHDGWFTGNWVAHNTKPVFGSNDKGKKPIKIFKAAVQCFAQCAALLHLPRQISRSNLGIVFGLDMNAFAAQLAAQAVVVRQ